MPYRTLRPLTSIPILTTARRGGLKRGCRGRREHSVNAALAAHMGECSTMSMVTQRSVERYARGSFLFTAFLEIALSTRRACVLQMQSLQYFII